MTAKEKSPEQETFLSQKRDWSRVEERTGWLAILGPDTPDRGEVSPAATVYLRDVAAKLLELLGLKAEF